MFPPVPTEGPSKSIMTIAYSIIQNADTKQLDKYVKFWNEPCVQVPWVKGLAWYTVLQAALIANKEKVFNHLITHRTEIDMDALSMSCDTALMCATQARVPMRVLRALLDNGGMNSINFRDASGKTALDYSEEKWEGHAILIACGALTAEEIERQIAEEEEYQRQAEADRKKKKKKKKNEGREASPSSSAALESIPTSSDNIGETGGSGEGGAAASVEEQLALAEAEAAAAEKKREQLKLLVAAQKKDGKSKSKASGAESEKEEEKGFWESCCCSCCCGARPGKVEGNIQNEKSSSSSSTRATRSSSSSSASSAKQAPTGRSAKSTTASVSDSASKA